MERVYFCMKSSERQPDYFVDGKVVMRYCKVNASKVQDLILAPDLSYLDCLCEASLLIYSI